MRNYLGQHFLINKDKLREIIEALELKDGDTVIEIGPGHGELTKELRIKNAECRIIAIEKDKELIVGLKKKIASASPRNDGGIEIIEGDALKILPKISKTQNLKPNTYKIVGNIPYYITGYLLRILGELENKPSLIVLTIQKEVAERVCAEPPRMNLLAASVQFWAKPEIVGYISKKNFEPMPEVNSAIIKLIPKITILWDSRQNKEKERYYKFIKILFKQPRKTIINNLEFRIKNLELRAENRQKLTEKLWEIGIKPNARPQDLSIEQIKELSTLF